MVKLPSGTFSHLESACCPVSLTVYFPSLPCFSLALGLDVPNHLPQASVGAAPPSGDRRVSFAESFQSELPWENRWARRKPSFHSAFPHSFSHRGMLSAWKVLNWRIWKSQSYIGYRVSFLKPNKDGARENIKSAMENF